MSRATAALTAVASLFLAGLAYSAFAQAPVPIPEPPHTLGRFLGIPQALGHVYDSVANRRGNHPRLERKGPGARLRRIADPAFLDPAAPPLLKVAAQIKMQEDLAPQKVKALKYLGSIGCGCYDKDGEVTAALLEGLADCTLEVRVAAVEVIGETAGAYCEFCQERSCCKPALAAKLDEMANGQDETGCWLEPSPQVRAAAAQALAQCGPIIVGSEPLEQQQIEGPETRPDTPTPPEGPLPTPEPMASPRALPMPQAAAGGQPSSSRREPPRPAATARMVEPQPAHVGRAAASPQPMPAVTPAPASGRMAMATDESKDLFQLFSPPAIENTSHHVPQAATHSISTARPIPAQSDDHFSAASFAITADGGHQAHQPAPLTRPQTSRGFVHGIDEARGVIRVRFEHDGPIAAGTPVAIVHETLLGEIKVSGRVDEWSAPFAVVRPFDQYAISRLSRGDHATLYVPQPKTYR